MIEQIILGTIQGIAEWLPVSSEGAIVLTASKFFSNLDIETLLKNALFLHLGTFFAALVYFHREVAEILKNTFKYTKLEESEKNLIHFLFIATLVSGGIGFGAFSLIQDIELFTSNAGRGITILIGVALLITGLLQLQSDGKGKRTESKLTTMDGLIVGIAQGFAVIPGISRSGITVATLLMRDIDKKTALTLSFLLSLPIVLAGNLVLNLNESVFTAEMLLGFIASFVFGLLTIDLLLKVARRINFGIFIIAFALITLVAAFI